MAPATLFGLVLVGAGLFVVAISRPLARSAAIIRTWFSSSVDVAWRTQREIPRVRLIAASWILLGAGFTIYGLITGP
jgi:hypothetical protein